MTDGRRSVQGGPSAPVYVSAIERKGLQVEVGTTSTSGLEIFPAPGEGRRYYITAFQLQSESDTAIQIELRSGGKTLSRLNAQSNGDGKIEEFSPGFEQPARANQPINVWISAAEQINYQVCCYEDIA